MATVFKIYGPHFPKSRTNTHDVREPHDGIGDDIKDVTARVTTRFQRVLSWVVAGNDKRWSAPQVGLRGHEAGLGGHDAGVSGDDEGVEKASIPLWKRGRMTWSDHPTFSDFRRFENENDTARQNHIDQTVS